MKDKGFTWYTSIIIQQKTDSKPQSELSPIVQILHKQIESSANEYWEVR